jgi:hypothetical protein
LLTAAGPVRGAGISLPAGERPVPVHTGVFLLNLSGIGERSTSFDADLYLSFRWHDSRLAFEGATPQRFTDEAAAAQLAEIWWPHLKFANAAQPTITSRVLEIAPDGAVYYRFGVTSVFRTHLDLRRFPFDLQTLTVRIQSFLWTAEDLVFVPEMARIGFNPDSTLDALRVTRVDAVAGRNQFAGWEPDFADFVVRIAAERRFTFYIWAVFAPVTLIFLISCAAFAVPLASVQDRLVIGLTALLTCVGTQFAVSIHLPRVSYLTGIDRVFVIAYVCIAVGVAVSTLEATLLSGDHRRVGLIDRWAGFGLPVAFFGLLALFLAR